MSPRNGIITTKGCNDEHSAPKVVEQPLQASSQTQKRQSVEPSEQPGAKRAKTSPAPSETSSTESSVQDPGGSIQVADSITKDTWQGFCEIQSEPAFFSTILKDMGVSNIKVQEVISFRPEFLDLIPQPSYGLILLYQYRDQSSSDQSEEDSSHVWFANQLPAQNSCATLAMINILMNNKDIDVGEHLQQFKGFTKDFDPYQRGEAFASFDFVKKIHNTFAKKMDILEADKHLSSKAKRAQRRLKDNKARRNSTDSTATDDNVEGHEENAHHFIAFIPLGDEIWMLDGLNHQPMRVGSFNTAQGQDWVQVAAKSILAILDEDMDSCTGFTLGPSPLPSLREQACLAVNQLKSAELRLDSISPDWKSSTVGDPPSPHPQMLGIQDQLSDHPSPDPLAATIATEDTQDVLQRRTRLLQDLQHLATSIASETQSEADDAQKAAQARFDHAPIIKLWAELLAANGYLEQHLDKHIEGKGGNKKGNK